MLHDDTLLSDFEEFVTVAAPRLQAALGAMFGTAGRDAAADALAYGWENWNRVSDMENAVGYLFVVGRDLARRQTRRKRVVLAPIDTERAPWVEPGLPRALAELSAKQRTVVMLLHCYEWTMTEVADVMNVSKSTVQSYDQRAMRKLRKHLGVRS